MLEQNKPENNDFLPKLKRATRIVLYGLAIIKSDCRKPVCISCHIFFPYFNQYTINENYERLFCYEGSTVYITYCIARMKLAI